MNKRDFLLLVFYLSVFLFQLIFYYLPIEIRSPLLLLCLIFLLLFWVQKRTLLIPTTFTLLFGFYFLANLYAGPYSPTPFQTTLEIIKILDIFFFLILSVNLLKTEKLLNFCLNILIGFGVFASYNGLLDLVSRSNRLPLFEPFHWPNLAASFFLLLYPTTLIFFLQEKDRGVKKLFLFTGLALLTTAWLLTRTYLVFFALISLVLFVIHLRAQTKGLTFFKSLQDKGQGLLLLIILVIALIPNLRTTYGQREIPKETALFQENISFQDKEDARRFSLESVKNHFWQGVGPGNFGPVYRQNLVKPWTWSNFASNELLQTSVEIGFWGLLGQLLLFTYLIIIFTQKIFSSFTKKDLPTFALAASAFCFLFLSFFNFSPRIFPIQIIFFLIVAILIKDSSNTLVSKKFLYILSLPVSLVALITFSGAIKFSQGQQAFNNGKTTTAEKIFQDLASRHRFFLNPKSLYWLTVIQLDKKEYQKAENYLHQIKTLSPYDSEIDYQIAHTQSLQSQNDQAIGTLNEALKVNQFRHPKYYLFLSQLYAKQNQKEQETAVLEKMKKIYPDNSDLNPKDYLLEANGYLPSLREAAAQLSKTIKPPP